MIVLPDTSTEVALATTTLSSAASTITFSSISSAYTDLRVVVTLNTASGATVYFRCNGDTATNYSSTALYGDGSSVTSARESSQTRITTLGWFNGPNPSDSNWRGIVTGDFLSYSGSTNKTVLITWSNDQSGSGDIGRSVGLWRNTSAVNSITILTNGANFVTGTTATLYGIL